MTLRSTYRFGENTYADKRAVIMALLTLCISLAGISLAYSFQTYRESNISSHTCYGTLFGMFFKCGDPYENYRCSVRSNKSDDATKCLTDVEAMTGHVLPLVSYVFQFYLVHEFFSFGDIYNSDVAANIWIYILVIFLIVAFGVYGSSCLHFYVCMIVYSTGVYMSIFVFNQLVQSNQKYFSYKIHDISQCQRPVMNKRDHEKITIVIPNSEKVEFVL